MAMHGLTEHQAIKHRSRQKLSRYVKAGKVTRPSVCELCMEDCKPEGHHEDYSKPLEVKWFCKRCHINYHAMKGHFVPGARDA